MVRDSVRSASPVSVLSNHRDMIALADKAKAHKFERAFHPGNGRIKRKLIHQTATWVSATNTRATAHPFRVP